MKKIDLGQTMNTLANVGVVVGIIFLAMEVRNARTTAQLQTLQDVTNGWIGLNESVVSDPHLAKVFIVGPYNPDALTDVEAVQFAMWLRMMGNQTVRVSRHYELGLIDRSEYEGALRQLANFYETPGGQQFYRNEPGGEEFWGERLKPYWGTPPTFELMLGRDKSGL